MWNKRKLMSQCADFGTERTHELGTKYISENFEILVNEKMYHSSLS